MKKDYREKQIKGLVYVLSDRGMMKMSEMFVCVRMTKDEHGASLSLQAGNVMIDIPLEQVTEIITLTERSGE